MSDGEKEQPFKTDHSSIVIKEWSEAPEWLKHLLKSNMLERYIYNDGEFLETYSLEDKELIENYEAASLEEKEKIMKDYGLEILSPFFKHLIETDRVEKIVNNKQVPLRLSAHEQAFWNAYQASSDEEKIALKQKYDFQPQ